MTRRNLFAAAALALLGALGWKKKEPQVDVAAGLGVTSVSDRLNCARCGRTLVRRDHDSGAPAILAPEGWVCLPKCPSRPYDRDVFPAGVEPLTRGAKLRTTLEAAGYPHTEKLMARLQAVEMDAALREYRYHYTHIDA